MNVTLKKLFPKAFKSTTTFIHVAKTNLNQFYGHFYCKMTNYTFKHGNALKMHLNQFKQHLK